MGFVSDFMSTITNAVESGAAANAAKVANAISPVFAAAIGLYIVYVSYEIIYKQTDTIMNEVIKNIASLAIVGAFTYSAPYYSSYVIPFVMHAGTDLSSAVMGGGDTASSIDLMWDKLSSTLNTYLAEQKASLGLTDLGDTILVYTIWGIGYVGGALLIYYSAAFLCISIFAVGIVLSAGVLFISFAFFQSTRKMFFSWCGVCLNYILLNLFYSISFGFLISILEKTINLDSGIISITSVLIFLLTVAVSVFLIEHIGVMSSTLTGGVGINGLTGSANGAFGKIASLSGGRAMFGVGQKFASNLIRKSNPALSAGLGKNVIGG
ncbi:TPA: type IV secretion system protein [Escherichia coli]|uniref:type IV secretion system protein n=1 Tax=Escherichia coli TaxID=562 RepID=UPI000FB43123|nr:type IV secretion system protein [Escherichia coli]EFA9346572.1 type IV secretion system protein [Escherichia coli]EFO3255392.1 conjugal transfer protein TraA [Escherichia coli]EHQ8952905.1 type IV secretion system protein [Escherichia coli]EKK0997526.1 type IV secretion system protein [Escherichia coli]EKP6986993.1 type IV secretion system protein [Escherichia coli]